MKKAILILAAVVVVFSGVAAVSAYEAHIVNVHAKVENALHVTGAGSGPNYDLDFGVLFPEQWLAKRIALQVSQSFCEQETVTAIKYRLFVEEKADTANISYTWPGQFCYVGIDPTESGGTVNNTFPLATDMLTGILGNSPGDRPAVKEILSENEIDKLDGGDNFDYIWIGIDCPVFQGYYNAASDNIVNEGVKPSGLAAPSWIAPEGWSTGQYVGFDLKVQISDLYLKQ